MVVETVIFVLYSYFAYSYTFRRAGQLYLQHYTDLNLNKFCYFYHFVDSFSSIEIREISKF